MLGTADPPMISVVIPSFNQAVYLEKAIRSVLNQDYPRLELVVADGGSSDGSREVIERFSDSLAWWCSEPDRGQAHAINKGFARTTGDVMAWLNSDDRLAPGASGFENLTLAGDWTRNGLNVGCVEATVMSAELAAAAIHDRSPELRGYGTYNVPGAHVRFI